MGTEAARVPYTAEDVYHILREEIISLKRLPGSAITENAVAERFGLSRTPVRSVFARLAQEGLLELLGRRGTFVSRINLDTAEQVIFLRAQVEYGILRHIALAPDALLFARLEANLARQEEIARDHLPEETFYAADSEFHAMCLASAGKTKLWQMIQSMDVHYARYRRLDYSTSRQTNTFYTLRDQHEELLRLMQAGETGGLYAAVTRHLYSGILRIGSDLFRNYSQYFDPQARGIEEILREVKQRINEV